MSGAALFLTVFLACAVEAVEATTIVVAAGTARHWRSALAGAGIGLLVLAGIVAVAGPALVSLPIGTLRLVVGSLLLVFGLQWLRKAVARASGAKARHDERAIFARQVAEASLAGDLPRHGIHDWYSFTLSFKAVLLEGLEVVFIALTFGANQHNVRLAAAAAGAAVVVVATAGFIVRGPLAAVPENTLKFAVGVVAVGFGAFWAAEGVGIEWPGGEWALLALLLGIAVFSWAVVIWQRRRPPGRAPAPPLPVARAVAPVTGRPRGLAVVAAFFAFWYDFIIGDDWRMAAGVAGALGACALVGQETPGQWVVIPVALLVLIGAPSRRPRATSAKT